ncbi:SIMPL domain-containing protein [Thiomicrorhabdus cannonii]|uniref:SIMPL domain-containing protein n=1 Tax=Thiomicrorhabdus cannonii TaxID=2748011 RepID=UPI0015BDA463|nr:SIMPL domain-containing protein [Thiomicrorhabdus cannonii]
MKNARLTTMLLIPLMACVAGLFSLSAQAEDATYHQVHFSISQSDTLQNDTAQVVLQAIAESVSAEVAAQQINRQMQAAIKLLKPLKQIKIQSGPYSVNPVYNKQRVIQHWRGQQTLTLTTQDLPGLPSVLSKLEKLLTYQSTRFSISETLRHQAQKKLIAEAMQTYQARASQIAEGFKAPAYELLETRIQTNGVQPIHHQPYMLASRAMAESAEPVMEAGESEIRVEISGLLRLPLAKIQ